MPSSPGDLLGLREAAALWTAAYSNQSENTMRRNVKGNLTIRNRVKQLLIFISPHGTNRL